MATLGERFTPMLQWEMNSVPLLEQFVQGADALGQLAAQVVANRNPTPARRPDAGALIVGLQAMPGDAPGGQVLVALEAEHGCDAELPLQPVNVLGPAG